MRKKTACFLAAMLFTTSMYAMKEITGEFQPWDGNSVVNGNTLNFLGEWNGMSSLMTRAACMKADLTCPDMM